MQINCSLSLFVYHHEDDSSCGDEKIEICEKATRKFRIVWIESKNLHLNSRPVNTHRDDQRNERARGHLQDGLLRNNSLRLIITCDIFTDDFVERVT